MGLTSDPYCTSLGTIRHRLALNVFSFGTIPDPFFLSTSSSTSTERICTHQQQSHIYRLPSVFSRIY